MDSETCLMREPSVSPISEKHLKKWKRIMTTRQKSKVKLGLYGCGNRTRALLDSLFMDEQYEVVAAYDMIKETAESTCAKYGGLACKNTEQLIGHPSVEAFLISLAPFAHPAAFHKTLEAGKPIFIEKPIAMTAIEAYRMMVAAEQRKFRCTWVLCAAICLKLLRP